MAQARRGRASRAPGTAGGRDTRVDMLRALALFSMFVAHCSPGVGPARVAEISEYLTAPLFAFLIGVGAQLGDRGTRALPTAFVRAGVRAAVLVALGLWLETWGSSVDVVLVYLALPTLFAPVLARLPVAGLLGLGAALWAAGPALLGWGQRRSVEAAAAGDRLGQRLWDVVVAGAHYRLTTLLVFTCLGIVVWRLQNDARSTRGPLLIGLGLGGLAALLWAAQLDARLSFPAYSGSHLEVFFEVLLLGSLGCLWFACLPPRIHLPALEAAGAMSLSIYVMQIAYLAWYVRVYTDGPGDDTYLNIVLLCVGALVVPMVWRSLVSREPWARGPIEGPTAAVTRFIR